MLLLVIVIIICKICLIFRQEIHESVSQKMRQLNLLWNIFNRDSTIRLLTSSFFTVFYNILYIYDTVYVNHIIIYISNKLLKPRLSLDEAAPWWVCSFSSIFTIYSTYPSFCSFLWINVQILISCWTQYRKNIHELTLQTGTKFE